MYLSEYLFRLTGTHLELKYLLDTVQTSIRDSLHKILIAGGTSWATGGKQKPWRSKWLGQNLTAVTSCSVSYLLNPDISYLKMCGWPDWDCGYKSRAIWLSSATVVPGKAAGGCQTSCASWGAGTVQGVQTHTSVRSMDPKRWFCWSRVWTGTSVCCSIGMPPAQIRISPGITVPQLFGQWLCDRFSCWLSEVKYSRLPAFQTCFSSKHWSSSATDWKPHSSRELGAIRYSCWETCHVPTQTVGIHQFSDGHCYLFQGSETARRSLCKGIFLHQDASQNTSKAENTPTL